MADSDNLVKHCDLTALRYCNSGSRTFFKTHNMDWDLFRINGLPFEDFLNTGDAMAFKVVEQAKRRLKGES